MEKYPEHEKLAKIENQSRICGDFYFWAVDKRYISNRKRLNFGNIEKVLAEFFEINRDKLEKEKQEMLNSLRSNI